MPSQPNIPRVTYTPKLATYMRKKGWHHIAIEHASACGCCVDLSEVATRFVDDAAADKLRAKGCVELHGELGSVLVARGMEYDDTVELGSQLLRREGHHRARHQVVELVANP